MLALGALTLLSLWLWTPDLPRATLEARYLAAPADLRQVGPWQLHVRDSGPPSSAPGKSDAQTDAPAVVLLHGFGSSLQTWDIWAQGLAATHRVVRIDLPGSGLSPPDPAHDYRGVTVTSVAEERRWNPRLGGDANEADFTGYMAHLGLPHPKLIDIAVPANLRCGRPDGDVAPPPEPDWAPLVKETADEISHALGHLPTRN